MKILEAFESYLDDQQRRLFSSLDSPTKVQGFLDGIPYSAEEANRCPLRVLRDRQAHCLDGALFAVAALRRLGHPPLVMDLLPDPGQDDDHVLALYKYEDHWGAVAKSNFVGLRYREAIYKTPRELALSYFEDYFNIHGVKTLRRYTEPINLEAFDAQGWMWRDAGADAIERYLLSAPSTPLLTPQMIARLSPKDPRAYEAGMLGADEAGIYQPAP
jgi:hypothetical protein